jgi:hypothetical protein
VSKKVHATLAVVLGAAVVAAGVAAPAFASAPVAASATASDPTPTVEGRTVAGAKTAVVRRIDLRLAALRRFDQRIERCRHLTDAHQATLAGFVDNATGGLTALRTKVEAETTIQALRADAQSMVHDYRVFLLRGPQVHGTCTADNETAAVARLREAAEKLAAGVAAAKQAGADTTAAEADLAAMDGHVDTAEAALAGQVDKLLALQPGPDGDALRSQVRSVRQQLRTALQSLRRAIAEAKQVREFLRKNS